jgi:hypothetical protein
VKSWIVLHEVAIINAVNVRFRAPRKSAYQPGRMPMGQPQGCRVGESAHDHPGPVADATEQGIQRVCKHQDLVVGFLAHTGLPLDP